MHVRDRLGIELVLIRVGLGFDATGEVVVPAGEAGSGHLFFALRAPGAAARLETFTVDWTYRLGHDLISRRDRFVETERIDDAGEPGVGFGPWNRELERPGPPLPNERDWDLRSGGP